MNYFITESDLEIILAALGEMPLKIAGPVFSRLLQQKEAANLKED